MEELIQYSFISWNQFWLISIIAIVVLFIASRFHLFSHVNWRNSIRFHMFFYVALAVVVVGFLLIRPFYHFVFLLAVFGLFYRNISAYTKGIFRLYFANVKMGDNITIGKTSGVLNNINFGGIHLLSNHHRVYFPFNLWKENKIILDSEGGKIPVFLECSDTKGRNENQSIKALEKSLFRYPYLIPSEIYIDQTNNKIQVSARISDSRYKNGLISHISKAGFTIKEPKS